MITIENNLALLNNIKLSLGDIRTYSYFKAYIRHISYDQRQNLKIQISFLQFFQLRKKSPSERRT
jgi:hypothetical protein